MTHNFEDPVIRSLEDDSPLSGNDVRLISYNDEELSAPEQYMTIIRNTDKNIRRRRKIILTNKYRIIHSKTPIKRILTAPDWISPWHRALGFRFSSEIEDIVTPSSISDMVDARQVTQSTMVMDEEVISQSDTIQRVLSAQDAVADTVTMSETVARTLAAKREPDSTTTPDSIPIFDSVTTDHFLVRVIQEKIAQSDAIRRILSAFRSIANTVSRSDIITRMLSARRRISHVEEPAITSFDAVAGTTDKNIMIRDPVAVLGDLVSRMLSTKRGIEEESFASVDTALFDSVTGILSTYRTMEEIVTTTEPDSRIERILTALRTVDDDPAITVTDRIGDVSGQSQIIADTIVLSETVARILAAKREPDTKIVFDQGDTFTEILIPVIIGNRITFPAGIVIRRIEVTFGLFGIVTGTVQLQIRTGATGNNAGTVVASAPEINANDILKSAFSRIQQDISYVTTGDELVIGIRVTGTGNKPVRTGRSNTAFDAMLTVWDGTVWEDMSRKVAMRIYASDSILISDRIETDHFLVRVIQEKIAQSDAIRGVLIIFRSVADTIAVTQRDIATRMLSSMRTISDSAITSFDAISITANIRRMIRDAPVTVVVGDTIDRLRLLPTLLTETITQSDIISRILHARRSIADFNFLPSAVWGRNQDQPIENFSTYTRPADAHARWNTTDAIHGFVNLINNYLHFSAQANIGNNAVAYAIPAGTISDTNFVFRFKMHYSVMSGGLDVNALLFGLSSENETFNIPTSNNDFIGIFFIGTTRSITLHYGYKNSGTRIHSSGVFRERPRDNQGADRWMEIRRLSSGSVRYTLYNKAGYRNADIVQAVQVNRVPAIITDLNHCKASNWDLSSTNPRLMTVHFDDIELLNDTMPISDMVVGILGKLRSVRDTVVISTGDIVTRLRFISRISLFLI